ncbi:hypothetical protein MnTg02_03403 [bacterium MnTg02]|nr:hypothetical protein MnTg02_03403 [bacterium MnTg02]
MLDDPALHCPGEQRAQSGEKRSGSRRRAPRHIVNSGGDVGAGNAGQRALAHVFYVLRPKQAPYLRPVASGLGIEGKETLRNLGKRVRCQAGAFMLSRLRHVDAVADLPAIFFGRLARLVGSKIAVPPDSHAPVPPAASAESVFDEIGDRPVGGGARAEAAKLSVPREQGLPGIARLSGEFLDTSLGNFLAHGLPVLHRLFCRLLVGTMGNAREMSSNDAKCVSAFYSWCFYSAESVGKLGKAREISIAAYCGSGGPRFETGRRYQQIPQLKSIP